MTVTRPQKKKSRFAGPAPQKSQHTVEHTTVQQHSRIVDAMIIRATINTTIAQQSTVRSTAASLALAKNTNRSGRPRTRKHLPLACIKPRTCKSYIIFTHAASPLVKAKVKAKAKGGGRGGGHSLQVLHVLLGGMLRSYAVPCSTVRCGPRGRGENDTQTKSGQTGLTGGQNGLVARRSSLCLMYTEYVCKEAVLHRGARDKVSIRMMCV